MNDSTNYLAASFIYGLISAVSTFWLGVSIFGLFRSGNPSLVPVVAFCATVTIASICAARYAFKKA